MLTWHVMTWHVMMTWQEMLDTMKRECEERIAAVQAQADAFKDEADRLKG